MLNDKINYWQHIFKLDPAKEISDKALVKIGESDTDAIMIGGTDNINAEDVIELMMRTRHFEMPIILEISSMDAIIPGFDEYFIPLVLNSQDKKWMMDIHHEAIKTYKDYLDFTEIFLEGYCIFNEDAKVFKKTNCTLPSEDDAVAYAYMAEKFFKLPSFYVEYSGIYGDIEIVKAVKEQLNETILIYGGGIKTLAQAREMKQYADIIVVGNIIYEDLDAALETTEIKES